MNKRVSIIIPSYGDKSNLRRAIDSVLNQDYENIEVIVVDDNGLGTEHQKRNASVIKEYYKNPKVHYLVHETNKGGSAARNTGAKSSSGDYLCFLDDDDEFADTTKISKQIKESLSLDSSWAGTYSSLKVFKGNQYLRMKLAEKSGYILENFLKGELSIGTAAPIITKSSFEEINGFDESFKRHQDWEFYCRLLDRFQLKAVPDAYYHRIYKKMERKKGETRLEYMNKYTETMKKELKSLPQQKLNQLMKRKYYSVILSFIGEGNYLKAIKVCTEQSYHMNDYIYLILKLFIHLKRNLQHLK